MSSKHPDFGRRFAKQLLYPLFTRLLRMPRPYLNIFFFEYEQCTIQSTLKYMYDNVKIFNVSEYELALTLEYVQHR